MVRPAALAFGLLACLGAGCKGFNANPAATILSHEDGSEVEEGALVLFSGHVSDPDDESSKLQATWSLGTTVICPAEVPEEDGSTACEAVIPSGAADLHLEVADDRRAVGSDVVTLVVLDTASTGGEISWDSTNSLSSADFSFVGEHSEDHAGWSISGAGDVDGDGLDDILVGAWANDQSGTVAGKAYLLMP